MVTRLNILLAAVLFFSCLWLVRSSYESRRLFVELEKAQSQSHELQIDYERLEVDKRAQATPLRVEKLAREKLRMFNNTPGVTHYVSTSASGVPDGDAGAGQVQEAQEMPASQSTQGASGAQEARDTRQTGGQR
jgi:cell division protein FtsL